MSNDKKTIDTAYGLVQLLTSVGCKTIYQNDQDDDFQVLMWDCNSGTVFSVECLPWTNSAEIRTDRNQHYAFPTEDIINRIGAGAPLFSDFTVNNYWDIPFVSLVQEKKMLNFSPLFARIDTLQGGPEEASLVYYTTGIVPGVPQEKVLEVEMQYQKDVNNFNSKVNSIIDDRMSLLPQPAQKFYGYYGKDNVDMYGVIMQKKR